MTRTVVFPEKSAIDRVEETYGKRGERVTEVTFYRDGRRIQHRFSEDNDPVEIVEYASDGTCQERVTYESDANPLYVLVTHYDRADQMLSRDRVLRRLEFH